VIELKALRAFDLGGHRVARGDSLRTDDLALVCLLLYRHHAFINGPRHARMFRHLEAKLLACAEVTVSQAEAELPLADAG